MWAMTAASMPETVHADVPVNTIEYFAALYWTLRRPFACTAGNAELKVNGLDFLYQ